MKIVLDKLALIVSVIASPFLVISAFTLLIIYRYSASHNQFLLLASIFLVCDIFLPFAFILYEVQKGEIHDIHITIREQRAKPFLVTIFGTLLVIFGFHLVNAPATLVSMTYVLLTNAIIFAIITQFWKISIHSAALAGSITLLAVLFNPDFAFLFLTVPLVAWARLRRHRHNVWQTLIAAIVTPIITLIILKLVEPI